VSASAPKSPTGIALDTITYSERAGPVGGAGSGHGILGAGSNLDNRNVGALESIPKGVAAAIIAISKRHLLLCAWMNWIKAGT